MTSTYDLPATQTAGNKWTDTLFNRVRGCIDFLREPPRGFYSRGLGDADYSITVTSFANIDGTNLSHTIITQGGLVRIVFSGYVTGAALFVDFTVDGSSISGNTTGLGQFAANDVVYIEKFVQLGAGSHTFRVDGRVAAGTAVLQSEQLTQFLVEEM